jgi:hypothetical protein
MVWRVLSYQLIFTLAAGPLLCCCTPGRLFAAVASNSPTPTKSQPDSELLAPVPQITSPCCAHKHTLAKQIPEHRSADTKSVPAEPEPKPGEKCPCKDSSSNPRTIQTQALSPDGSTVLRLLACDLVAHFAPFALASQLAQTGLDANRPSCWNALSLSTAELLYAHHNLRC